MFHRDYQKVSFGGGLQPQFAVHINEQKRVWVGEDFAEPATAYEKADRTRSTTKLQNIFL